MADEGCGSECRVALNDSRTAGARSEFDDAEYNDSELSFYLVFYKLTVPLLLSIS